MEKMNIEFQADFNFIPGTRLGIARLSNYYKFTEHEAYQIATVVDELCNNAVEHGSKSPADKVLVECEITDGDLRLKVKDSGNKKLDINEIFSNNKRRLELGWHEEEICQRGRGLLVVQRFVDNIAIEQGENGTTILIRKLHKEDTDFKK